MARVTSSASVQYSPDDPPEDPTQLVRFLRTEFLKLEAAIKALAAGHLEVEHVAPTRPRAVDLRVADGTDWNPGSGFGLYAYNGTAWVLVKAL